MNTLDDLRGTLEREADALHDTERYIRPVAVHARIRAVRRRRAAAVAAAAVLFIIGAVAGFASLGGLRDPEPAGNTVIGVEVPERIELDGVTYRLTGSAPADGPADWGDWKPHAVILVASGLGTGTATLFDQGEPVAQLRAGEGLAAPVLVEGAANVYVRLDGVGDDAEAGIAIYTATDAGPVYRPE